MESRRGDEQAFDRSGIGRLPIVQAPLAGGPSTPELAAAVSDAGGLGFVAAGMKTPEALALEIAATRALTARPFGVNVFVGATVPADPAAVASYAQYLREHETGELGLARSGDDDFDAKVGLLVTDPVAVVSFTFGCPDRAVIAGLKAAGSVVWVTVTSAAEARQAAAAGADVLVVQGIEAGGHRGTFVDDDGATGIGLLALLQLVGEAVDVPLVAAGGIATGRGVAAVLAAGAIAAQIGSAFLRCPEAGTADLHRAALAGHEPTALTRAFTGRQARGIVNRFLREHTAAAPAAYPEVLHLTAPLRAKGRDAGDADVVNLWAGQAYELGGTTPAAELTRSLADEAGQALDVARERARR